MNKPKGIGGIIDQIVGGDDLVPPRYPSAGSAVPTKQTLTRRQAGDPERRMTARRGRPLGSVQQSAPREPKAKVTVWIRQRLIDQYRDWSWDARCPLSTLMQQAMEDYQNRRRTPSSR